MNITKTNTNSQKSSSGSKPAILQGWEHSVYAHKLPNRYAYIGKKEDTGEPQWVDNRKMESGSYTDDEEDDGEVSGDNPENVAYDKESNYADAYHDSNDDNPVDFE